MYLACRFSLHVARCLCCCRFDARFLSSSHIFCILFVVGICVLFFFCLVQYQFFLVQCALLESGVLPYSWHIMYTIGKYFHFRFIQSRMHVPLFVVRSFAYINPLCIQPPIELRTSLHQHTLFGRMISPTYVCIFAPTCDTLNSYLMCFLSIVHWNFSRVFCLHAVSLCQSFFAATKHEEWKNQSQKFWSRPFCVPRKKSIRSNVIHQLVAHFYPQIVTNLLRQMDFTINLGVLASELRWKKHTCCWYIFSCQFRDVTQLRWQFQKLNQQSEPFYIRQKNQEFLLQNWHKSQSW